MKKLAQQVKELSTGKITTDIDALRATRLYAETFLDVKRFFFSVSKA
jgi:hypothetical protein